MTKLTTGFSSDQGQWKGWLAWMASHSINGWSPKRKGGQPLGSNLALTTRAVTFQPPQPSCRRTVNKEDRWMNPHTRASTIVATKAEDQGGGHEAFDWDSSLTMIGAQSRQPSAPTRWSESIWEELCGGGVDNSGRFFLLGWSHTPLHVMIPPTTSAPPSDSSNNSGDALLRLATLGAETLAMVGHCTS